MRRIISLSAISLLVFSMAKSEQPAPQGTRTQSMCDGTLLGRWFFTTLTAEERELFLLGRAIEQDLVNKENEREMRRYGSNGQSKYRQFLKKRMHISVDGIRSKKGNDLFLLNDIYINKKHAGLIESVSGPEGIRDPAYARAVDCFMYIGEDLVNKFLNNHAKEFDDAWQDFVNQQK